MEDIEEPVSEAQTDVEAASPVPVVEIQTPPTDEPISHMDDKTLEHFQKIHERLAELSGKLDGIATRAPEPVEPAVVPQAEEIEEQVEQPVDLVLDTAGEKSPKIEPEKRRKRGLRHGRSR